ncbi:TraB/GumN family protein [Candidatus Undinarchaeota archaeon]
MAKEIFIVPTAHLSKKSIRLVRDTINKTNPDAVAVELCKNRYHALLSNHKAPPWEFIKRGHFFMLILSILQNYLSKKIGLIPGAEMLEAVKIAKKKKIPIALIDQNFFITMSKLKKVPLSEKFRLLFLSAKGFKKMSIDDMTKEENLVEILEIMKAKLPKIYKVLVHDRNHFMARQLKGIPFNRVVAVVGAGHAKGIKDIIDKEVKNANRRNKKTL